MSASQKTFGGFKRPKVYKGHPDDLFTTSFGFYAFFTYRGTGWKLISGGARLPLLPTVQCIAEIRIVLILFLGG